MIIITLDAWLARPATLFVLGLLLLVGLAALFTCGRLLRRGDVRDWARTRAQLPTAFASVLGGATPLLFREVNAWALLWTLMVLGLILSGYVASMRAIRRGGGSA